MSYLWHSFVHAEGAIFRVLSPYLRAVETGEVVARIPCTEKQLLESTNRPFPATSPFNQVPISHPKIPTPVHWTIA